MNNQHTAKMTGRLCAVPESGKRALILWLAAFPTITLLLMILQPLLAGWPLAVRTLLLTAIMVPTLQFVLVPRLMRWFGFWFTCGDKS